MPPIIARCLRDARGPVGIEDLSSSSGADAIRADTLADALAHAYAYNTDLASARAHLRGVDEQVPQALAGWRPTVTLRPAVAATQTFNTGTSNLLPKDSAISN